MRWRLGLVVLTFAMSPVAAGWLAPTVAGAACYSCGGGGPTPNGEAHTAPLGASATLVKPGASVTFTAASGTFAPNTALAESIKADTANGDSTSIGSGQSNSDGSFSFTATMPSQTGTYYVEVTGLAPDGTSITALIPINVDGEGNVIIGPAALTPTPPVVTSGSGASTARRSAAHPDEVVPAAPAVAAPTGGGGPGAPAAQAIAPIPHRGGSGGSTIPVAIAVVFVTALGLGAVGANARRLQRAD